MKKKDQSKVTAAIIQKNLIGWCKRGYHDIVIPNFFFGFYECDLFQLSKTGYVTEYEIKVSRADFFNDFKKNGGAKHKPYASNQILSHRPNRFVFVVPEGMVKEEEVPDYAGLLYFKKDYNWFDYKKGGKLLHKTKYTDFQTIAYTLAARCQSQKNKIEEIRDTEWEKEMRAKEREVEDIHKKNNEMNFRLLTYISLLRKHKIEIP